MRESKVCAQTLLVYTNKDRGVIKTKNGNNDNSAAITPGLTAGADISDDVWLSCNPGYPVPYTAGRTTARTGAC